jgi:O-6-methylguanine DNA methyltransferase
MTPATQSSQSALQAAFLPQTETITCALGQSQLGAVLVACSKAGVCAISVGPTDEALEDQLGTRFGNALILRDDAALEADVGKVVAYLDGVSAVPEFALDMRGTPFQKRVWEALLRVPAGETISYTALAQRVGAPKATRAVASACAANTIAFAIPCHRVIRADGGLSGYRWGVETKRALLANEAGR